MGMKGDGVCVCMWCMVHVWYLVFLMVFHRDRCLTEASEAVLVQSESHGEKSVVCIRKSPRALFVFFPNKQADYPFDKQGKKSDLAPRALIRAELQELGPVYAVGSQTLWNGL